MSPKIRLRFVSLGGQFSNTNFQNGRPYHEEAFDDLDADDRAERGGQCGVGEQPLAGMLSLSGRRPG